MSQGRKILGLYLFLIFLFVFGCQQISSQKLPPDTPIGAKLFHAKCGSCHDLERALNQYRSADLWRSTISRMKEQHGAEISPTEVNQLVEYHIRRQQQEAAIFKEKCLQCHSGERFLSKELTPSSAKEIIKRMQQKAGNKIEDKDIEIIVRYHVQAQKIALEKRLAGVSRVIQREYPLLQRGQEVFKGECSLCHRISRTLGFRADSKLWDQTIEQLKKFSNDSITTKEIDDLADWHVDLQRKQVAAFKNTCTRCHDDRRINQRSMTEEQWVETIRRMLQKSPELFSDEKVSLIAAYFHRREFALAKTFSGPCLDCHTDYLPDSTLNRFPQNSTVPDKELSKIHAERQRQEMHIFETKCFRCHPKRSSENGKFDSENTTIRSRTEWIALIANLQNVTLNEATKEKIGYQIDFHLKYN